MRRASTGRPAHAFFTTWLFTGAKPAGIEPAPTTLSSVAASSAAARTGAPVASVAVPRFGDRLVGR